MSVSVKLPKKKRAKCDLHQKLKYDDHTQIENHHLLKK